MIKYLFAFVALFSTLLAAREELNNLIDYDKATCLEKLENASDKQLWDVFLRGQANLFFESESSWLAKNLWWKQAKKILEIGSGNGAFLYKLSNDFQAKVFHGIEKLPEYVKKANAQYVTDDLTFQEGDAEIYDRRLAESADIVLFRMTLQHLEDSTEALRNAAAYLAPNGYVVIIDSFDKARKNSPPISAIDEAMQLASEVQKSRGKGNRRVLFELLQAINSGTTELSNIYEIEFSSVDIQGNVISDTIRFEGLVNNLRYFNHTLLFLTLFQRTYHISVNLEKAYDELQVYISDENAWTRPGMHFLVLRKK
ncbi:MAG: class I SAM-dependent methyltransferase [Simkaniaceae bacterium]|nr:class I SAM-dependent methyltransferase [Simkaniaceae bacterium]